MRLYRIADKRHSIFDGTGAKLFGGRWNTPGRGVIYAAESFAGAMLETLVHINMAKVPRNYAYIEISAPDDLDIEIVAAGDVPGWDHPDQRASRDFGDRWLDEVRSAVLLAPSLPTFGIERNALINPAHSEFPRIVASEPKLIEWDNRLFKRQPPSSN